jgi:hypothetical protein
VFGDPPPSRSPKKIRRAYPQLTPLTTPRSLPVQPPAHLSSLCSFNIVDIKPPNMEELTEVITSAQFQPTSCRCVHRC